MSVITTKVINSIKAAFDQEREGIRKFQENTDKEIQRAVDCHVSACKGSKKEYLKGNSRTNKPRAEVAELFAKLSEAGHFSGKTARQYCSCFWAAFETGTPFSRNAVNKKSESRRGARVAESGEVRTTNVPALAKTLQKAIGQCRLLAEADGNFDECAAALLDIANEFIDGFEESD